MKHTVSIFAFVQQPGDMFDTFDGCSETRHIYGRLGKKAVFVIRNEAEDPALEDAVAVDVD